MIRSCRVTVFRFEVSLEMYSKKNVLVISENLWKTAMVGCGMC